MKFIPGHQLEDCPWEHEFLHRRISGTRHAIQVRFTIPDEDLIVLGREQVHKDVDTYIEQLCAVNQFGESRDHTWDGQINFLKNATDLVVSCYANKHGKSK